jgi:hypothetical protein
VAVLAVIGERLSGFKSLLSGKIQGNFADLAAKARREISFPSISQLLTPKFPTHPNREFSGANREFFPAEQGKSLAKSPADGIFGRDKTIECLELPQEQTSASAALMSPNDPEADLTIRRILTIKVSQSLQSSAAEIGKV